MTQKLKDFSHSEKNLAMFEGTRIRTCLNFRMLLRSHIYFKKRLPIIWILDAAWTRWVVFEPELWNRIRTQAQTRIVWSRTATWFGVRCMPSSHTSFIMVPKIWKEDDQICFLYRYIATLLSFPDIANNLHKKKI